ncbi:hypothetical protein [Burkholderia stagnalis]|uniref:hypothetical protein n=1 Tax=Burkholderia stagnalis TaxID=1503054 RepID=UPI00075B8EBD|nr:hypothetical protein [Burkholderia stagnalis]KVN02023.1 hypothetical protein WT07_15230 [Burkholderia stagnalis]KWE07659.1 hypothetical protein WT47_14190 [Burkholderia stagnalis]KWE17817.1 hypothetical protein WT48_12430 [Burkholderia stagnalis]KWO90510.1 hypothetical protein WU00_21925 [Burkholderia stagnalis]
MAQRDADAAAARTLSVAHASPLHPAAQGARLPHAAGVGLAADACALGLMMALASAGMWMARWRSAAA